MTSGSEPFCALVGGEVAQPVREEAGDVEVERGRAREHLRVARPAEPLVALRAVGRHADEVALLPPHDVVVELVEHRVGAGEGAGARHVGVHDDAGDRFRRRRAWQPFDLHEAEAVEGEVRLEGLLGAATQRVAVRLLRGAKVGRVEVAVLVEHLGVLELDRRAGGSRDAEPHPADHVLPHVVHGLASRCVDDLERLDLLDAPDRRAGGGDDVRQREGRDAHGLPIRVGEAGLAPACTSRGAHRTSLRCRCRRRGSVRSTPSSSRSS